MVQTEHLRFFSAKYMVLRRELNHFDDRLFERTI